MGYLKVISRWMMPFLVGILVGTAVLRTSAQGAAPGLSGATAMPSVLGDGGIVEAAGLAERRYDIFLDERKQVEQNLGFTLGDIAVITPQPGMRGYYTRVTGADVIALTGPWFREDQVRQTVAHEMGHLAHTLAGIPLASDAEREAWAETFRSCFGSDEARAPRWGPKVTADPATCAEMRQAIRDGIHK